MPFGFHLAMDTLPSGALPRNSAFLPLSGQRGITPAFGYGAPHPGARGTSTLLNNVLLSTQYATVRLPSHVHVRRVAHGLLQPARSSLATGVPGVSRFSRLEFPRMLGVYDSAGSRVDLSFRLPRCSLPPPKTTSAPRRINKFRSSIPGLRVPLSTLRPLPYGGWRMTRGQGGSLVLSYAALSSGRVGTRRGPVLPTSPRSPLSFRTASFPQYGCKAGMSDGAFPGPHLLKPLPAYTDGRLVCGRPSRSSGSDSVVPHCVGPMTR